MSSQNLNNNTSNQPESHFISEMNSELDQSRIQNNPRPQLSDEEAISGVKMISCDNRNPIIQINPALVFSAQKPKIPQTSKRLTLIVYGKHKINKTENIVEKNNKGKYGENNLENGQLKKYVFTKYISSYNTIEIDPREFYEKLDIISYKTKKVELESNLKPNKAKRQNYHRNGNVNENQYDDTDIDDENNNKSSKQKDFNEENEEMQNLKDESDQNILKNKNGYEKEANEEDEKEEDEKEEEKKEKHSSNSD